MNKDFIKIRASCLFSGINDEELTGMLRCLNAKIVNFSKGEYILRPGDTVESIGLIVSGSIFIIQEDFWGNRNILSSIEQGQCPWRYLECQCCYTITGNGTVFECKTDIDHLPLCLRPSQPDYKKPAL